MTAAPPMFQRSTGRHLTPKQRADLLERMKPLRAEGVGFNALARKLGSTRHTLEAIWRQHIGNTGAPDGLRPCAVRGCGRSAYGARAICTSCIQAARRGAVLTFTRAVRTRHRKARTCQAPGCDRPHRAKGRCAAHLQRRVKHHPDPDGPIHEGRRRPRRGYTTIRGIPVERRAWTRLRRAAAVRGLRPEDVVGQAIRAVCDLTSERAVQRVIAEEFSWLKRASEMEGA